MDQIDGILLEMLVRDAECTAQEMTERVHLSVAAINKRIAKLKTEGVIERYTIKLDSTKIGKPVTAYVLLVIDQFSSSEQLLEYIGAEKDIVECHAITGSYDYLIKVVAKDISDLEDKLLRIKRQTGVAKTNTLFSLREHKSWTGVLPD